MFLLFAYDEWKLSHAAHLDVVHFLHRYLSPAVPRRKLLN